MSDDIDDWDDLGGIVESDDADETGVDILREMRGKECVPISALRPLVGKWRDRYSGAVKPDAPTIAQRTESDRCARELEAIIEEYERT